MRKAIVTYFVLVLCLSMLLVPVQAVQTAIDQLVAETSAGLSALDGKAGTLLGKGEDFPAGTSVCDWTAMALALSGSQEDYDAYLRALKAYVEQSYAENGGLDRVKSTTYHRIALVVLALGGDPESFGTKPGGTAIDLIADGTYAFAGDNIGAQGLNGWIYSLIALDASGAVVPDNAKFTREDMISAIVTAQEPDGGFGLVAGKSDVDITAMALQALAPYQEEYPEVIEAGLAYLSGVMNDSCRFSAYDVESAESSAQAILALCALGIDPDTDSRFCRGSQTLLTGLDAFRQEDGTYGHSREDSQGNFLATAQTLLALRAVQKLRSGEGWIFDFTNFAGPQQKAQNGMTYTAIGIAVILIICIVIAGKRKKHGKNNR